MSEQKKIALKAATQAQLRAFAQAYLGMSFPPNAKTEAIRSKIRAAWTKEEIPIEAPEAVEDTPQGTRPPSVTAEQRPPGPQKIKIIIQRTDEPGGDEPVPLGVNGRVMLVPRGEEVEIPTAYFEVLKNAVTHRYEALKEGGLNPVPREVPMYPFQRIG